MEFDVAIVGSGLAGLSVALNLAETRRVAVVAKRSMTEGASDWAQGGIAAVLDSADSIENHVRDTLIAWYERRGYHRTGETEPYPYGDNRFGTPLREDLEFAILEKRF